MPLPREATARESEASPRLEPDTKATRKREAIVSTNVYHTFIGRLTEEDNGPRIIDVAAF